MQMIPYIGYSLYQLFLYFCFWSFIGWCIEVVDMTYETGEYQNRGFLNMPICPIEGLGMVMVIVFFKPLADTIVPLFFASLILCTAFELSVGLLMEKLFHARWWDYSHMKFNYKGFICLRNSLFFGGGCVVCLRIMQPLLENAVNALPVKIGLTFVFIMSLLIILDTTASVMSAIKFRKRIRRLDELSNLLLSVSVKTGMKLATGTLAVKSNVDTVTEKARDVKENMTEKARDVKENVTEKVQNVKENVTEKARDMKENVTEKVLDVKENVTEKARDMKENVTEKVLDVKENVTEKAHNVKEKVTGKLPAPNLDENKLQELREEYDRLLNEHDRHIDRILRAYPRLKLLRYSETLTLIRSKLPSRKGKDERHDENV